MKKNEKKIIEKIINDLYNGEPLIYIGELRKLIQMEKNEETLQTLNLKERINIENERLYLENEIIELKEHINDLERYIKFTETNYEEQISNLASHNLQLINENHQLKAKNIEQKSEIKYFKQALNNLYGRDIYE